LFLNIFCGIQRFKRFKPCLLVAVRRGLKIQSMASIDGGFNTSNKFGAITK